MKFYYVYILQCSDNSYYIGITNNVEKRLTQHRNNKNKSSYTYSRKPLNLVWKEQFTTPLEAIKREKQIKGWSRKKKEALINENWDNLVKYSKNYTDSNQSSTGSD